MGTYTLYIHLFPNNKKYVGVTRTKTKYRWKNGHGYKPQVLIYRAIQKYGWNNIQHIIICENLSKEWAYKLEQDFIRIYKSNDSKYGYNLSNGGEGSNKWTLESRLKLSKSLKGKPSHLKNKHLTEEHKLKISRANRNPSMETRRKMSESHKGKRLSPETIRKNVEARKWYKHSEETKKKMSVNHNRTLEYREKLRQSNLGRKPTDKAREKMSKAHKGTHWYTDGVHNTQSYICPKGYYLGRTFSK